MNRKERRGDGSQAKSKVTILVNGKPFSLDEVGRYATEQHNMGHFKTALDIFNLILAQVPEDVLSLSHRGNTLKEMHHYPEALASYDEAIRIKPDFADAYSNRGNVLQEMERYEEALESHNMAIQLNPNHAVMYFNRGTLLKKMERYEEALLSYDKAAALQPDFALAYHAKGAMLYRMKRFEEALKNYDKAIALKPDMAYGHGDRGSALLALKRYDEAVESYNHAIALKPDYIAAYDNRGAAFQEMQRFDEALADYNKALSIDLQCADAHWNKALLKLLLGQYEEGWALFEWRWKSFKRVKFDEFKKQLWLGKEPIAGKTLLLHVEQGFGDAIQFCRYVPMVEALGAKVILRVPEALYEVMTTLKGNFQLIKDTDIVPVYDYHCPLMSLPLVFNTTVATIPAEVPYLFADPVKAQQWKVRLGIKTVPRIGLVWSGGTQHVNDRYRSIPLAQLAPLLGKNYEFHSLQKEYRNYDAEFMAQEKRVISHADDIKNFADTAALISQMDLVVTVDTSVAHLSAALGKPTWILITHVPDYRWMMGRDDSPWYATVKLFRQDKPGDWDVVIAKLARQLAL